MSSHVSVYIGLPTRRHSGDVTVTDGMGKFYSFFWGKDEWVADGVHLATRLRGWLDAIPCKVDREEVVRILREVAG